MPAHLWWKLQVFNAICCSYGTTVKFFEKVDFEGEMYQVSSSANCANLPAGALNLRGSIRTTKFIVIYWDRECNENDQPFVVQTDEKRLSEILETNAEGKTNKNTTFKSFGNCEDLEHVRNRRTIADTINYKATVFHMEINHNGYGNLVGRIRHLSTLISSTVLNNSSVTATKSTRLRTKFKEYAQFQFYWILRKMRSIEFESYALKQFEASLGSIPFSLSKATVELKTGLPTAFRRGSPNLVKDKPLYYVETNEYFQTYQTFDIPKCKKYLGNLFLEVTTDIVIHYTCHLKITAENWKTKKKLTASEIRQSLRDPNYKFKFLDGDSNADEFTAVAEEPAWFRPQYINNVIYHSEVWRVPTCPF